MKTIDANTMHLHAVDTFMLSVTRRNEYTREKFDN